MATASEIAVARAPAQLIDTALARAREYKRVRTIVRAHPAGRSQSGPAARSRMTGAVEGMPVGGASAHLKLGLQPGPGQPVLNQGVSGIKIRDGGIIILSWVPDVTMAVASGS